MGFDSLLPEDIEEYAGELVLTTRAEAPASSKKMILCEDELPRHPAITLGAIVRMLDSDRGHDDLVIGVDPGQLLGLSIFYYGHEIEAAVYTSVDELVSHMTDVLGSLGAKRKLVRIGDGDMQTAREIGTKLNISFCSSFQLEYVDEHYTSRKIRNFNRRGRRDMLSARQIASRSGYRRTMVPLSITG